MGLWGCEAVGLLGGPSASASLALLHWSWCAPKWKGKGKGVNKIYFCVWVPLARGRGGPQHQQNTCRALAHRNLNTALAVGHPAARVG